jgi:4-hydroxy-tetrahydrodipicolinate reductase
MKIALIGYGSMGKTIEKICLKRGHEVIMKVDADSDVQWKSELKNADVAIEFTEPHAAEENMLACFQAKVPVVTGTTGWYSRFEQVRLACEEADASLFYATNFSIGVNLFFQLNRTLARLMATHPEYEAKMEEIHHLRKKDAPSGTAITLSEAIIAEHPAYIRWSTPEISRNGDLQINSIREGDVPGTHEITYRSEVDEISIKHAAFNRLGFAEGAVVAAEFIFNKKGIFTMSDLLNDTQAHGL